MRVVHNAIDSRICLADTGRIAAQTKDLIIGTVGQLTARKGRSSFAAGGSQPEGRRPGRNLPDPRRRAATGRAGKCRGRLGLINQVSLSASLPPLAWVQVMDVCVLCSSKEGLPRVVLEAMLAASPVVGSDVTGTRELVVHEQTGLLYTYGDVAALTASLRRSLTDADYAGVWARQGRQRVAERYSIEAHVAGVMQVLDEAAR